MDFTFTSAYKIDVKYGMSTYMQPCVNILCKMLFIYAIELFVDLHKR